MSKKETSAVLEYGNTMFFFYPGKNKDGYVHVFNSRNQCIGRAPATGTTVDEVADEVETWLVNSRLIRH